MSPNKKYKTKPIIPTISTTPSPGPHKFKISEQLCVKLVIVLQLLFLAIEFYPDLSTNGDDAVYFILGKSLAHGHGYTNLHLRGEPVETQFPIVFPGFLALSGFVSDFPLLPKIAMGLISIFLLLLIYKLIRLWSEAAALPVLIVMASFNAFAEYSTLLLSEVPFLFATIAAIFLYEKYKNTNNRLMFIITVIVSILPVHTRTIGIAFCVTFIAICLFEKKYSYTIAHIVLLVVTLGCAQLLSHSTTPYLSQIFLHNSYDPEKGTLGMLEIFHRIFTNISIYLRLTIPQSLTGFDLVSSAGKTIGIFFTLFVIGGWIRNFALRSRIFSIYGLCYFCVLSLWFTIGISIRFLVPFLPFAAYFLILGVDGIAGLFFRQGNLLQRYFVPIAVKTSEFRFKPVAIWVTIALLSATNISFRIGHIATQTAQSSDWKNFYSCADWVRLHTPQNAIVVSRKPELFYLRSNRKGLIYPFSHDVEKVVSGISNGGASYVIMDNFFWTSTTSRYLYPAIMANPQRFNIVYSLRNPDTFVLEFK